MICLVTHFLYADDLVLTVKDRIYLQAQLNALNRFSRSLKMEMNMDKSKVMVMQKQKSRATARKNSRWRIGDNEIKECASYKDLGVTNRTITLISQSSKILLKISAKRLAMKLNEEISEEQASFRPGKGTRDQIMNLKMVLEKSTER